MNSALKIAAIIGTTASGKSDFALKLALKTGAHILSCDSLLVYKDLNIGTAKPSEEELNLVPHYGINLVNAGDVFTAGDYVRYAKPILEDCISKNIPLLIVGGTGFYLKALLLGVWEAPPTNQIFRDECLAKVSHLPKLEQNLILFKKLEEKDLEYSKKIKANDQYRVLRALEIIETTGSTVTEMLSKQNDKQTPPVFDIQVFGIDREKTELDRRITERANKMFEKGLVKETKELIKKYSPNEPRALHCVGYDEVIQFIGGGFLSIQECRERVIISTRQLAKKQRTFFKGMGISTKWFHFPNDEETCATEVIKILSNT